MGEHKLSIPSLWDGAVLGSSRLPQQRGCAGAACAWLCLGPVGLGPSNPSVGLPEPEEMLQNKALPSMQVSGVNWSTSAVAGWKMHNSSEIPQQFTSEGEKHCILYHFSFLERQLELLFFYFCPRKAPVQCVRNALALSLSNISFCLWSQRKSKSPSAPATSWRKLLPACKPVGKGN